MSDVNSTNVEQDPLKMKVPEIGDLSDFVRNALEKVAKQEGFTKFELRSEAGANIGDGFVGIMLRVTIEGTKYTGKVEQLNVLCKVPPMSELRREQFQTTNIFTREIVMYNEVLPALAKFQKSKGIKEDEGFFNFPKCYVAAFEEGTTEALLIMEDLREQGYGMANKFQSLDFPHARLVMEGLGRLHALSFALKMQDPELLEKYKFKDILTEMLGKSEIVQMWHNYFDQAIAALGPDDTVIREKLVKFKENILDELACLVDAEAAEPYTVLNHVSSIFLG